MSTGCDRHVSAAAVANMRVGQRRPSSAVVGLGVTTPPESFANYIPHLRDNRHWIRRSCNRAEGPLSVFVPRVLMRVSTRQWCDQHHVPSTVQWPQQPQQTSLHPAAPMHKPQRYSFVAVLGRGSFGTVYKANVEGMQMEVAIKSIKLAEARHEMNVLIQLRGCPNIITLLGSFYGCSDGKEEQLNLVMEYIPDTLSRIIKHQRIALQQYMSIDFVRLYAYQLMRGLSSLGRFSIIHRDIKPANILVDPSTLTLKICDFGSATFANADEADQPYICSRYYRAPELILSAPTYNNSVDIWSAGCVVAEMVIGQPVFPGKNGVDQLLHIMEVLGTPTPAEFHAMNPQYDAAVGFEPRVKPLPWEAVLSPAGPPPDAAEFVGALLTFDPGARKQPLEALGMRFFDHLRRYVANAQDDHNTLLLVTLTPEELSGCTQTLREKLTVLQHGIV